MNEIKAVLPPLFCPFEEKIHPKADWIQGQATKWLDNIGLARDSVHRGWLLATDAGDAMSRIFPNGDESVVALAAQWLFTTYDLDDRNFDLPGHTLGSADAVELASRFLRVLEAPGDAAMGDNSHMRAVQDYVVRMRAMAPMVQAERHIDAWRHLLLGFLWEVSNTERGLMPNFDDYARLRIPAGGGWLTLSWSEISSGHCIPEKEWRSPAFKAAAEAAFLVMGWDNDLVTHDRELELDPKSVNVVSVIAKQRKCSREEAIVEAISFRDRTLMFFLRMRAQLFPSAAEGTRRYLDDLGHAIRANLDWGISATRHTTVSPRTEIPVPGPRIPLVLSEKPSSYRTDPLPLPSIAWWWDHLD
ncbi:terpene synthase family protein [Streptomyces sp. NPDC007818]|uniref:terpene synthase family protein n=1 Tax=Streptomyces sp. NPDC007818 TaxID=3364780 RepID=UPI0036805F0B